MKIPKAILLGLAGFAALTALPSLVWAQDLKEILKDVELDRTATAISGVSSGAAMASQLQFAHFKDITGVGLIAAPPYGCAKINPPISLSLYSWWMGSEVVSATTICTGAWFKARPMSADDQNVLQDLVRQVVDHHGQGDWKSLCARRTKLIIGDKDTLVTADVARALETLHQWVYQECDRMKHPMGVLEVKHLANMPHVFPTDSTPSRPNCPTNGPFISDCDYAAAVELLKFLHPERNEAAGAGSQTVGALLPFSQAAIIGDPGVQAQSDLHDRGYVFVPSQCRNGKKRCSLHVALHGGNQNEDLIEKPYLFARDAGYNEAAENMGIVVLYPQTKGAKNPPGNWDWWGYTDANYYRPDGVQLNSLWKIIQYALQSARA